MASAPLSPLGQIAAMPGGPRVAQQKLIIAAIGRHVHGDWGAVCAADQATNDEAASSGLRILSAYPTDPQQPCEGHGNAALWVSIEHDRRVTTVLLPGEY